MNRYITLTPHYDLKFPVEGVYSGLYGKDAAIISIRNGRVSSVQCVDKNIVSPFIDIFKVKVFLP